MMKFQASNRNGLGNRFRCFLSALRMNENATIYWSQKLEDGVTKPNILNGNIEPLEELIQTDKSVAYDETSYQVSSFAYFVKSCESDGKSPFYLYEKFDKSARNEYVKLAQKYLQPTNKVRSLSINGFKMGFQIRTKSELITPPKRQIDDSILQFILNVKYPIFVACDNKDLSDELSVNPNVFMYCNEYKYEFDQEWTYSLAEVLTMGGCKTLYVTPGSTYGEMGYLFGGCRPVVRSIYKQMPNEDSSLK